MLRRRRVSISTIIPSNNKFFHPPPAPYVSLKSYPDDKKMKKKMKPLHTPRFREGDDGIMASVKAVNLATNRFNSMLGYYPISDFNSLFYSLPDIHQHRTILKLAKKFESQPPDSHYVVPDIDTCLILFTCHARSGNFSSAFFLFREIIETDHRPSTSILNDLFRSLCIRGHIYNYITLKSGFQLNDITYYLLVNGLCRIGEAQRAIHLFRQVKININCNTIALTDFYNSIILTLCKDRLVNQAYDFYSEMIVKNIPRCCLTYHYLINGYCIIGEFKQAIALLRELDASPNKIFPSAIVVPTLVTEGEVKDAKTVVAVMVKCGVKPNVASYHSVIDQLYRGDGKVNKIAQMLPTLLLDRPSLQWRS
ncbi:pentatricopeptide repeat-containing protein At1g12775, mitochondrial [Medicago truncatula]|uniref:pentatricopeptide repeat-containing protein At1g12775, mitochondrial n=1 Tax=Medicago truncatula TaxID=3880 RepID=UPI000D2F3155|nr:pentatricopeptide repeat-containing protein At1g12775, mitochondrial [Medicago truncatula]